MSERLGTLDIFPPAKNYAYLDAASVSLMHSGAAEAIVRWQQALAEEGTLAFDEQAEVEVLDNLTLAGANLVNATPRDIAVASSETVLMSSLAWAVSPPRGTEIVATRITHPSTIYPWRRVAEATGAEMRWVGARNDYVDPDELAAAITGKTSVVCLSHVEYGTGQTYDLKRFADLAHRNGAILVVDVTQSAGQVPIDIAATGADAVAFSTYKWLCGPFGTGIMYVSPELQRLNPGIVGWRSHKDMWDFRADRLEMPDSAKRYEFGTMAYGCALGATKAVEYLLGLSIAAIQDHNRALSSQLIEGLRGLGAVIVSPTDVAERSATVAVRFPGRDPAELARSLKSRNVILSLRQDYLRLSPHLYNASSDIDSALSVFYDLVRPGG